MNITAILAEGHIKIHSTPSDPSITISWAFGNKIMPKYGERKFTDQEKALRFLDHIYTRVRPAVTRLYYRIACPQSGRDILIHESLRSRVRSIVETMTTDPESAKQQRDRFRGELMASGIDAGLLDDAISIMQARIDRRRRRIIKGAAP